MLFNDAVQLMLLECESRHLSKSTIRYYALILRQCGRTLSNKFVCAITVHDLRAILLSAPRRSAIHHHRTLKRFFNFLVREEIISRNPAARLDRPKAAGKIIEALSINDVNKLLNAAKLNVHRGHNSRRDVVIITTLLATGLRSAELCGLRDEDVRLEEGAMLVSGKGNKQRLVPIPTKLKPMLLRYRFDRLKSKVFDHEVGWFFRSRHGGKLEPQALTQMISKTAKRAGIKAHAHRLRHSFATEFMGNDGADILTLQAICGWSTLSMAQRYAHSGLQKMQRSMEAFSPIKDI